MYKTLKSVLTIFSFARHVLSDGRLVVGARRSLMDAGSGAGAMLRCRASNRAGTVLSRPVMLQPGELFSLIIFYKDKKGIMIVYN